MNDPGQSGPGGDAAVRAGAHQPRLVVRLPNWVGDVCMALPALKALADSGLELHCFGKPWAIDLLSGLPYRVHRLPKGLFAAAGALRAVGCQQGLTFTNSLSSAFHMRWAGIKAVGYRKELRSALLHVAVLPTPGVHEVEAFWRLAQVAVDVSRVRTTGSPPATAIRTPDQPQPPPPTLDLPLTSVHRDAAQKALTSAGVSGPFSVLCPLAVGLSAGRAKQWPSFPLLCRGLVEQGEMVVACPGPGEAAACAAALPGARLLDGLGLGAYAAVMSLSRRVVANDSGPMHLAAAVGAPVLGIFGVSDPERTRPWGPSGAIVGNRNAWPTVQAVWESIGRLPGPNPSSPRDTSA